MESLHTQESKPANAPLPADTDHSAGIERARESQALWVGSISFIAVAVLAIPVFQFQPAPIAGEGSAGNYAALTSGLFAFLAFLAGRYVVQQSTGASLRFLDHLDVLALGIAHALVGFLSWALIVDILDRCFIGAEVFPLATILLSGAAVAMTGYLSFLSSTHMSLTGLATVMAIFLAEGVIASALSSSDPRWWMNNLSALGMTDDLSAMTFNITVITAGFLVTTLARYVTKDISWNERGARRVRVSLIVVGIFLMCVGIFHVDDFFLLHTGCASGMAVVFGVLIIALRWWMPGLPGSFHVVGYVFVAVIVVSAIYFATGIYNLTAVELVAGPLVFAWLILFIRSVAALQRDRAFAQRSA